MPRFHHANVAVTPDLAEAEADFLVGVLGYRRLSPSPEAVKYGARWFAADDGTQVHISVDAEHRPAALAHTALDVGQECAEIEQRLEAAGIPFRASTIDGVRAVHCNDPGGNRWELRG